MYRKTNHEPEITASTFSENRKQSVVLHLEGLRHAVEVSGLLRGEAFVRCVASVRQPGPLLKFVHAVLSLFCLKLIEQ